LFGPTSTRSLSARRESATRVQIAQTPKHRREPREISSENVEKPLLRGGGDGKLLTRGRRCSSAKVQLGNPGCKVFGEPKDTHMRLRIIKGQNKGMLGGVSFQVQAQVELSDEERNLIQHYKLEKEVVLSKKLIGFWGQPLDVSVSVTVQKLMQGDTYKCKDLNEVIGYRDSLMEACKTLKGYLEVARSFGGEEVVEIS